MQENSDPALFEIPQLENIEILSFLGQGGMSTVYRGRQIDLDRIVAVKVLTAITTSDAIKRFRNEAKLACNLHHPNIIQTYSFDVTEDGQPYIVLEFLEGESLSQLLKREKQLSLGQFREIFVALLDALEFAHQRGLIHRDLKPANIMLCKSNTENFKVKLVDFGIAKQFSPEDGSKSLTGTGEFIGTPQYMSPEQCQGIALDNRSDIYSISCVMYESLLAEPLFQADSAFAIMQKHYQASPPSSKELCRRFVVDKALISTILAGLSKAPEKRPQSARDLAIRIERALEGSQANEYVRPKKAVSPLLLNIVIAAVLITGLLLGLSSHELWKKHEKALLEPQSTRDLNLEEVDQLFKNGDLSHALEKYDAIIGNEKNFLNSSKSKNTIRTVGYAYLGASKCIFLLRQANGSKSGKNYIGDWVGQSYWYAHQASKCADSADKDRQLFMDAQRQKTYIFEPNTTQQIGIILGIIRETEQFADNKKAQEFSRFKHEQLERILSYMKLRSINSSDSVRAAILEELEQSKNSFKEDSLQALEAKAIYAQYLAHVGERNKCFAVLKEIKNYLYFSKPKPLARLPLNLRIPVISSLLNALEIIKNPDLAKEILKLEIETTTFPIKQRAGDLHCSLARVYRASSDDKRAIDSYLDALELCGKDKEPNMEYINHPDGPFAALNNLLAKMTYSQKTRFETIKQAIWKIPGKEAVRKQQ